ncbi:hypothetical protein [Alkalinema sp. FACHB-956]|uniref:hypothetical protein n=1 Tax=Alkalinema sp. FACHB-956 TaxID=2692768 RepID=UPI0016850F49|nr:hypothetical protein [Alkalinema sp. FACHB-956]MBD2325986.1 hypothetical protein [Alkalinema sp. FACHB-956]
MNKTIARVAIFCLSWMLVVCSVNASPIEYEFTLKPGQEVAMPKSQITVQFDSVLTDSRCPIEVDCYWAGNAEVKLTLQRKRKRTTAIFKTAERDHVVQYRGYAIRLTKLSPDRQSGKTIAPEDYRATLAIKK